MGRGNAAKRVSFIMEINPRTVFFGFHTRIRAGFPRDLHRQIMFLGPLGP